MHFLNRALHIKGLFGQVIVLALDEFPEALDGIRNLHVAARNPGKLLSHVKRLRKKSLDSASSRYGEPLLFAQFINTQDRDYVLQVFVLLQNLLYRLRNIVVLLREVDSNGSTAG